MLQGRAGDMGYDPETITYSFADFSKMSMEDELRLQCKFTGKSVPGVLAEPK